MAKKRVTKLDRVPIETGLHSAIMKDKKVAEAYSKKTFRKDGPRAVSDAVLRKLKRSPNYILTQMLANMVCHRKYNTPATYMECFVFEGSDR